MKRSKPNLDLFYSLPRSRGPLLLSVGMILVSSLVFTFAYRSDLLIFAAQQRRALVVKVLVGLGAKADSSTEIFPEPALIEHLHGLHASEPREFDDGTIARELIRAGAILTERNAAGWTPLMLASAIGQNKIVELLVEHGAEIDARGYGSEQTEGVTALMAAAMHGHTSVVQLLVDKGANIHLRSRAGFTALLLAASRGHNDVADVLVKKGASVPLSTVQVAERNGHLELAEMLRTAMQRPQSNRLSRRLSKLPEE